MSNFEYYHHLDHADSHNHFKGINGTLIPDPSLSQGLIVAKIVSMIVLGCVSFILGLIPIKVVAVVGKKKLSSNYHLGHGCSDDQPLIISLLLCFGGGVLMFTAFIHLQPEVREAVDTLTHHGVLPESEIPISELFFCGGFFFVYIVEEMVHVFLDKGDHDNEEEAVLHRTMSIRRCSKRHHNQEGTMIPRVSLTNGQPKSDENGTHAMLNVSTIQSKMTSKSPLDPQIVMTGGPLDSDLKSAADYDIRTPSKVNVVAQSFRGFLAVMALSFHAVFEGLAVGLEQKTTNVWYLFGAIATHKFVIAFCVGMELVSSKTKRLLIILYIGTFAAVTPLGIGIGTMLSADPTEVNTTANLVATVLQGMAAGTLLYVVFFEVLEKERANSINGACQLMAILLGFCVMMALGIFSEYDVLYFLVMIFFFCIRNCIHGAFFKLG